MEPHYSAQHPYSGTRPTVLHQFFIDVKDLDTNYNMLS
jgi:hypothetical protein